MIDSASHHSNVSAQVVAPARLPRSLRAYFLLSLIGGALGASIVVLAVIAVYLAVIPRGPDPQSAPSGLDVTVSQGVGSYPQSYVEAGLPQYPGAAVNFVGDPSAADPRREPVAVALSTTDDAQQVLKFFGNQLGAGGWTLDDNRTLTTETSTTQVFVKDQAHLSVTVATAEQPTAAALVWRDEP